MHIQAHKIPTPVEDKAHSVFAAALRQHPWVLPLSSLWHAHVSTGLFQYAIHIYLPFLNTFWRHSSLLLDFYIQSNNGEASPQLLMPGKCVGAIVWTVHLGGNLAWKLLLTTGIASNSSLLFLQHVVFTEAVIRPAAFTIHSSRGQGSAAQGQTLCVLRRRHLTLSHHGTHTMSPPKSSCHP